MSNVRRILIAVLVLGLVMALPVAAGAKGQPSAPPGKPDPETGKTCQSLIDNGAVWDGGDTAYDEATGTYVGVMASDPSEGGGGVCIDILPEDYVNGGSWTVTWNVDVWDSTGSIEGLLLLFEQGVTGKHLDEKEFLDPAGAGPWTTKELTPIYGEPFVFVAMHDLKRVRHGDTYRITFTVTPPSEQATPDGLIS